MQIQNYSTEKEFVDASIEFIKKICNKKEIIRIGLSGGSSPIPVYKALAKEDLPFERMEFYQVDERYVPKNHKDSNYKLIKNTLLKNPKVKKFYFFDTRLEVPEALKKYKKELPESPLDLLIMGIGPDGHTASLFPAKNELNKKALQTLSPVAHTQTDEFAIKDRLTITFPLILKSKKILILLKGKEKEETLKKIIQSKKGYKDYPAKKILNKSYIYIKHD